MIDDECISIVIRISSRIIHILDAARQSNAIYPFGVSKNRGDCCDVWLKAT